MAERKKTSNRLLLVSAKEAEALGDNPKAVALYQQAVSNDPLEEHAWQRLMVIHRKEKDYKSELKIINLALKSYETHTKEAQKQWLLKNKKAATLFKSLAKSLGLMDSKGTITNSNPILDKWNRRKEWVMARLKKRTKK
jgi:tetratricopeptide (TPR) repeat protein